MCSLYFYPRSPCGERRESRPLCGRPTTNLYPRSPCGERRLCTILYSCPGNFYPRSPCGERQQAERFKIPAHRISIHALLAESDETTPCKAAETQISIHALLAESDADALTDDVSTGGISIHALLAESDLRLMFWPCRLCLFLSTLSLRRATNNLGQNQHQRGHFYPRSPCGERPVFPCFTIVYVNISIHALLAESDRFDTNRPCKPCHFYPRSPCGERHCFRIPYWFKVTISIHALHTESDSMMPSMGVILISFLSTLSLRRATRPIFFFIGRGHFIHALPCGERRKAVILMSIFIHALPCLAETRHGRRANFYPRSPCGESDGYPGDDVSPVLFLSTLSFAESDSKSEQNSGALLRI